ncbi:MAG: alpha/beta fold hydrolase [Pseudomonadota bacterium]
MPTQPKVPKPIAAKSTPLRAPLTAKNTRRCIRARDGVEIFIDVLSSAPAADRGAVFVTLPTIERTAREFAPFAHRLCETRSATVFSINGRGRGGSGSGNYGHTKDADDLLDILTGLGIEHAHFVASGYGGLVAMSLAASRPGAMLALTLVDSAPALDATGLARLQYRLRREPSYAGREQALDRLSTYEHKHFPNATEQLFGQMLDAAYCSGTVKKQERWIPDMQADYLKRLTDLDLSESLTPRWNLFTGLASVPMMIVQPQGSTLVGKPVFQKMLSARKKSTVSTHHMSLADQGSTPILHGKLCDAVIDFHLKGPADR